MTVPSDTANSRAMTLFVLPFITQRSTSLLPQREFWQHGAVRAGTAYRRGRRRDRMRRFERGGRQVHTLSEHQPQGLDQHFRRRRFRDKTHRPALYRCAYHARIILGGEHYQRRAGNRGAQCSERVHAVEARHLEIEQHQVIAGAPPPPLVGFLPPPPLFGGGEPPEGGG